MRLALLPLLLLAGCSALATPYRQRDQLPIAAAYEAQINDRLAGGVPRDAEVVDRVQRNEIISEIVWMIDADYDRFEASLYLSSAALGTAADLATLGATGAAAALSSGGSLVASAVLTGVAAAVTGTRLAVQEQFFAQHGRIALIATMRQKRAEAMTALVAKMRLPLERYPLSRAMVDVQRLANAGTIVTALQAIVDTAVTGEAHAEGELRTERGRGDQ